MADELFPNLTPTIQCWRDGYNPLKQHLASLDKVFVLDVDQVLPGHRRIFGNHRDRITELKEHHRRRCEEALDLLKDGSRTAYETASGMTWDLDCEFWDDFPVAQQWFATGEAISHLRYLEDEGRVVRGKRNDCLIFSLCNGG